MITSNFLTHTKNQLIILIFLAIALNVNTLFNEYVLDDYIVMADNKYVNKGFAGIKEIFTTDLMTGFRNKEHLLSQPRYRPFTLAIFAIEYQFFGKNATISHLINILFFVLLIYLLFVLLEKHLFREQQKYLAFFTCLLFVTHPVHTEVIANVKSRDELETFILLLLTSITLINYFEKQKLIYLTVACLSFLLALLTRESAVTYIAVVPLIFYFFYNQNTLKNILFLIPLVIVLFIYLFIRYSVIGLHAIEVNDIFNAPFLFATATQAFATKVFILLKYILLLIFPHPLSFDYSYNQIPYVELFSFPFIISSAVFIALLGYAIYTFKEKSILSFSILYFTITISLVTNIVVDIGTPFSERLLFQPSLAFCIAVAFFYLNYEKKIKLFSNILFISILIMFSIKTIARNTAWKTNETLFSTDVNSSPNSAISNFDAAEIYRMKSENETDEEKKVLFLETAIKHYEMAIKIAPHYAPTYIGLGFAYYDKAEYEKAADLCFKGYTFDTTLTEAKTCMEVFSNYFYKKGNAEADIGNIDAAIISYKRSIELNSKNIESWYNLGGSYYIKNDSLNANKAWDQVKKSDPKYQFNKANFIEK